MGRTSEYHREDALQAFCERNRDDLAQWREQARLLFALQGLASGERVIDVAFDCGYASQSAFTAMFRHYWIAIKVSQNGPIEHRLIKSMFNSISIPLLWAYLTCFNQIIETVGSHKK